MNPFIVVRFLEDSILIEYRRPGTPSLVAEPTPLLQKQLPDIPPVSMQPRFRPTKRPVFFEPTSPQEAIAYARELTALVFLSETLTKRERAAVAFRLAGHSFAETGRELGVCTERARSIVHKAGRKLLAKLELD